ncbi:hypothetical protein BJX65DRAFT_47929 [Aspergillus insuetus]
MRFTSGLRTILRLVSLLFWPRARFRMTFNFLHYDVATSFQYQVEPGHLHNHCYRLELALLVTEPKNIPLFNILSIGIAKITSAHTAAHTFQTLAGFPRALPYPLLPLKFGGAPTGINPSSSLGSTRVSCPHVLSLGGEPRTSAPQKW